jgi:hypothetical protein
MTSVKNNDCEVGLHRREGNGHRCLKVNGERKGIQTSFQMFTASALLVERFWALPDAISAVGLKYENCVSTSGV